MNIAEKLSEFVEIERHDFELKRELDSTRVKRDLNSNPWHSTFIFDENSKHYNLPEYDAGIYRVILEHQNPNLLYAGFMYVKIFSEDYQWFLFSPKSGVFNEPISSIMSIIYFQRIV